MTVGQLSAQQAAEHLDAITTAITALATGAGCPPVVAAAIASSLAQAVVHAVADAAVVEMEAAVATITDNR